MIFYILVQDDIKMTSEKKKKNLPPPPTMTNLYSRTNEEAFDIFEK